MDAPEPGAVPAQDAVQRVSRPLDLKLLRERAYDPAHAALGPGRSATVPLRQQVLRSAR